MTATVLPLPVAQQGQCMGCPLPGACATRCPDIVQRILAAGAVRVGSIPGAQDLVRGLAEIIDHTLLKPDAVRKDVEVLCAEADRWKFASVCVNPAWVGTCARLLVRSPVRVCPFRGAPSGPPTPADTARESGGALDRGATELDMVVNVGALKSGDQALVERDIRAVVDAAHHGTVVKVILETAFLSDREKVIACQIAREAGADFVKTSTGFGPSGATVQDIQLMRATVGPAMGVKASGGVRDTETAVAMVQAGATRIGASASVKIIGGRDSGARGGGKY